MSGCGFETTKQPTGFTHHVSKHRHAYPKALPQLKSFPNSTLFLRDKHSSLLSYKLLFLLNRPCSPPQQLWACTYILMKKLIECSFQKPIVEEDWLHTVSKSRANWGKPIWSGGIEKIAQTTQQASEMHTHVHACTCVRAHTHTTHTHLQFNLVETLNIICSKNCHYTIQTLHPKLSKDFCVGILHCISIDLKVF